MKALLIIANENYQDQEYEVTKKVLEKNKIETITAAKTAGKCRGKFGAATTAVISIDDLDVSDYDAVIFIGGPGAVSYQQDVQAHLTAQEATTQNKVLAAICIAPTILAEAGVLEGRKATVWNNDGKQAKILIKNGAAFTNAAVTIDGKIITANGPEAAEKFGQTIVKSLNS